MLERQPLKSRLEEKAVLVGLIYRFQSEQDILEYMDELAFFS